jgi:hypothetical protein
MSAALAPAMHTLRVTVTAVLLAIASVAHGDAFIKGAHLAVTFSSLDGSLVVEQLDTGDTWTQEIPAQPYAVSGLVATPSSLSATLTRGSASLKIAIAVPADAAELTVAITPTNPLAGYVRNPDYPYPFTLPAVSGYYVQNTSADGALFSLSEKASIQHMYDFLGIPWWGLTDFDKAMMAILESPYLFDDPAAVVLLPVKLRYCFMKGGYVELARSYRQRFLAQYPELQSNTLAVRAARSGFANLKNGVYAYFWGSDARNADFMNALYLAGLEHVVAMIYNAAGNTQDDADIKAMYDVARGNGWTAGMYLEPGGNLAAVAPGSWNTSLMLGADPVAFFAAHPDNWERTCSKAKSTTLPTTITDTVAATGIELLYYDTFVVQESPCLDASHAGHNPLMSLPSPLPSPFEEERGYRVQLLDFTRGALSGVGSGEGASPAWAIPHLDYFEGGMMLRTYGEMTTTHIPGGDYAKDFVADTEPLPPGLNTDETHRIPLLGLMFHDTVVTTWDWRDSNFQHLGTYRKKNLFNALYGSMPMWNMTAQFWADHQALFLDSYAMQKRARDLVGFDDLVGHGWLSADREVQYTDWASGVRIIANFDSAPRVVDGQTVPALDFIVLSGGVVVADLGLGGDVVDAGVAAAEDGGGHVEQDMAEPIASLTRDGCSLEGGVRGAEWCGPFALIVIGLFLRRRS